MMSVGSMIGSQLSANSELFLKSGMVTIQFASVVNNTGAGQFAGWATGGVLSVMVIVNVQQLAGTVGIAPPGFSGPLPKQSCAQIRMVKVLKEGHPAPVTVGNVLFGNTTGAMTRWLYVKGEPQMSVAVIKPLKSSTVY